jgi:hypothetical protein
LEQNNLIDENKATKKTNCIKKTKLETIDYNRRQLESLISPKHIINNQDLLSNCSPSKSNKMMSTFGINYNNHHNHQQFSETGTLPLNFTNKSRVSLNSFGKSNTLDRKTTKSIILDSVNTKNNTTFTNNSNGSPLHRNSLNIQFTSNIINQDSLPINHNEYNEIEKARNHIISLSNQLNTNVSVFFIFPTFIIIIKVKYI